MADKSMREAYGDALLELADDETVVVLDADLAKATSSINFAKNYPERFFDMGISEQNLMGTAAGMAVSGLKPYVSTFAMFAAGRAFEQVRNAICYAKAGVRIVATHAGLSPNADGGSHETIEDIALMRVLPGMTVLSPCDYNQAKTMIKQMKDIKTPSYIRLSRHPVPTVTKPDAPLQIGVIDVLRDGADVCIAATGIMVAEACSAAEQLKEKGIDAAVLNVHTIKPLDSETILRYAGKCPLMVTVEEHSVIGGLGSAICEVTAGSGYDCRVSRMGIQDKFGQSGDLQELMNAYELTASHIVSRVIQLTGR
ncbi:MAG: transketolase family protein [Hungatella hathewayi]|nr:transketolase family protein [Hungatella hathewayi]